MEDMIFHSPSSAQIFVVQVKAIDGPKVSVEPKDMSREKYSHQQCTDHGERCVRGEAAATKQEAPIEWQDVKP